MEIERKFLVNIEFIDFDLNKYELEKIEQYYISLTPEVRFRKIMGKETKCFLTVKGEGDMIRKEVESPIDEILFEKMKECMIGNLISKKRYLIKLDNRLNCELDIYEERLKGLATAEIEFESEEMANKIGKNLPKWFGKEVTWNKAYKNKMLSQKDLSICHKNINSHMSSKWSE